MYSNSIQNDYGFDDQLITENFKQDKSTSNIFTSFSFENSAKNISFGYRPFVLFTFAIEHSLWGDNPHLSHLINILLYAFICILIYYLLLQLFPGINKFVIFLTTIIFIINPLHTEPVNNIKSRDELLIAFFGIISLILYLKHLRSKKILPLLLIIVVSVLGILSKKDYVMYLCVIPLVSLIYSQKIVFKEIALSVLLIIIPLFVLGIFKRSFLDHSEAVRIYEYFENPLYFTGFFQRIPAGLSIIIFNLLLIILPFRLSLYYGYNYVPIHTWSNILPYFSLLLIAFLIFLFIRTLNKKSYLSFGIGLLLINLLVISNIIIPIPGIIAERFLIIGTLGFSVIIAYFLYCLLANFKFIKIDNSKTTIKQTALILILLLCIPFIYKTYSRNFAWKNTTTLLTKDIPHLERSAKANELMGSIYISKYNKSKSISFLKKAEKNYKQCVNIYPKYPAAWNNLGYLYFISNDLQNAEIAYKNALEYNVGNPNPPFNLALLNQKQGNIIEAKNYYLKAIEINPTLPNLLPYFKSFVQKEGLVSEVIPLLKDQISKKDDYNVRMLLIDLYFYNKDFEELTTFLNDTYQKYPTKEIKLYTEQFDQFKKNNNE